MGADQPWGRTVESETHSVRPLLIRFDNQTQRRWMVVHVSISEPVMAAIRPVKVSGPWARDLDLDWIVASKLDNDKGESEGRLTMRFQRAPATDDPGPAREIALVFTLSEKSKKGRRCKLEARHVQHF